MDRIELLKALDRYRTSFEEERVFIPRFKSLLVNFETCYRRSLLSGHITASAFIVDDTGKYVLLLHHKKLDRWLQPGGHADGEENIALAAIKEAQEETGLQALKLKHDDIFDLDIHLIPTHRDVNAHFHYDVRFLFVVTKEDRLTVSDESNDLAWVPIEHVGDKCENSISILRMVCKAKLIFN